MLSERKARKQRALARNNWFLMKMFLKGRVVTNGRITLTDNIKAKLDVFADVSADKILQSISLRPSIATIKTMSAQTLKPVVSLHGFRPCLSLEQIAENAAFKFAYKYKFARTTKTIAKEIAPDPSPFGILRFVRHKPGRLNSRADRIAKEVFEKISVPIQIPDFNENTRPVAKFSQDNYIVNHEADEEFIIGNTALQAVMGLPIFAETPIVSRAARNVFRGLFRMAYPPHDRATPLRTCRDVTMADDDDFFDRVEYPETVDTFAPIDQNGFKMYEFDLSEIFGEQEREEKHIVNEIVPKALAFEKALHPGKFWDGLQPPVAAIADDIAHDIEQHISQESVDFVACDVHDGLLDFVRERVGLNAAAKKAVSFQMATTKSTLTSAVGIMTFSAIGNLTPFLFGAANIKMHKLPEEEIKRRQKRNMVNGFRTIM